MQSTSSQRLKALDVLRGITVAGMILVNNPGSWSHIYAPLRHAEWNGLTPTDLVFPFFMFMMGISACFSFRRFDFRLNGRLLWKIVRRTVVIFAIGLAIGWFATFCFRTVHGLHDNASGLPLWAIITDAASSFDTIRVLGVLPRLALCYFFGSLIALVVRGKALPWLIAALLIAYALILLLGHGYEFSDRNVISVVDHAILGADHMYTDHVDGVRLRFDPEGLLSTLPSVAHMLIGFWIGLQLIDRKTSLLQKINLLFITGTILIFAGFLLSYALPVNKKIWSPTFVLSTCGLASLLLALLIWIIDVRQRRSWCTFFEVFGVNPLFLYVLSDILAILGGAIVWTDGSGATTSLAGAFYSRVLCAVIPAPQAASLAFALIFVSICWLAGLPLYNRKIYIKI